MATFTWTLQGSSPTTIDATDIIQFAAASFSSAITVGAYNDSTHVESNIGANDSNGNSPHNTKYLSSTTMSLNGAGSANLSTLTTGNSPLKINFSHGTSVVTTGAIFYAYDASTTTSGPTGVTVKAAEQGDSTWGTPAGSASAIAVDDDTTATSHDYYFAISASPDSVGTKTAFKFRMELTYS